MVGNSRYTKTAGAVRLGAKNNIVEPKMPGLRKERVKGNISKKGSKSNKRYKSYKSSVAMTVFRKWAVAT